MTNDKSAIQLGAYHKAISETTVRLGPVRFSYAHVFEPRVDEAHGKTKYSVAVLIPKADREAIQLLNTMIVNACAVGASTKWGGVPVANCKSPILDGDLCADRAGYSGMVYLHCASKYKPSIQVLDDGVLREARDRNEFYSGCWGAVTIALFPYGGCEDAGVGCGLINAVKIGEDERLDGGRNPMSDFADLEAKP